MGPPARRTRTPLRTSRARAVITTDLRLSDARTPLAHSHTLAEEDDAGNVVTTWTSPHAPGAILAAITATAEAAHEDGAEWAQPLGGHDAYKLGITVTHNGKTWVNLTAWNTHEPGVSGWREVVTEGYPLVGSACRGA